MVFSSILQEISEMWMRCKDCEVDDKLPGWLASKISSQQFSYLGAGHLEEVYNSSYTNTA